MSPGFTCDAMVDDEPITYKNGFLNAGCCSDFTPAEACDMQKFATDAAEFSECTVALTSEWEDMEENCKCWNALGADYRAANFNCIPDEGASTVMDMYNNYCANGDAETTVKPADTEVPATEKP